MNKKWSFALWSLIVNVMVLRGRYLGLRRRKQGDTEELCNDKVSGLHLSQGILRVIRSRVMKWTKPVARVEEKCIHRLIWNLKERSHLKDMSVEGTMILTLKAYRMVVH
jgi:hypothetical protein